MSETNHRREAQEWLAASSIWESPDDRSIPMMLAALTHAVLALTDAMTTATRATAHDERTSK